jgi:hypothetical protein
MEHDPIQHGPHTVAHRQHQSPLGMIPDKPEHDLSTGFRRSGFKMPVNIRRYPGFLVRGQPLAHRFVDLTS